VRELSEVRGNSVGSVAEYPFKGKAAKPLELPGAGDYLVTFHKEGLPDYKVLVHAKAGGGTVTIAADLASPEPSGASRPVPPGTIRTRERVGFRVKPATARVSLNGTDVGAAGEFTGGLIGGKWLRLAPGLQTITLSAPGYKTKRVMVEASSSASSDKEVISEELDREQ
jgi:hypothetical protein